MVTHSKGKRVSQLTGEVMEMLVESNEEQAENGNEQVHEAIHVSAASDFL